MTRSLSMTDDSEFLRGRLSWRRWGEREGSSLDDSPFDCILRVRRASSCERVGRWFGGGPRWPGGMFSRPGGGGPRRLGGPLGGPLGRVPSGLGGAGLLPSSSEREPCYPEVSTRSMTKANAATSCAHVDKNNALHVGTRHVQTDHRLWVTPCCRWTPLCRQKSGCFEGSRAS